MSDVPPRPPLFIVREAAAQDLPYIRAWLPEAVGGTPAARLGLAREAATGAIAGCAALRVFPADGVARFLLFVDPALRRRGCGTALLEDVRQAARRAGAVRLLTGRSYPVEAADADSAAALAFFRARGLSVGQDILGYRAELKAALAVLEPLYRRSVRGPASARRARIVTADQVDRFALADFAVRHLGGYPEEVAARLAGGGRAFALALSMVALEGDRIVGAVLLTAQGQTVFIESRIVEAGHRGGWINLALMYHGAAAAEPQGITTLDFEGEAQDQDTTKLARRLGAALVARRQCWSCPLPPEAAPEPAPAAPPSVRPGWRAEALSDRRVDGLELPQLQERLFFDSVNDVIQVLAERSVETMSVANQVRGVTLHLRLERHGPEAFDRTTGLKHGLLFVALPRSASLYVFNTLADGLALDRVTVDSHRFPREAINPQTVARLAVPGTISHSHADARLSNLALLNPLLDRLVVHVRDPRQAVLSAVHHLNDLRARHGPAHVAGFDLPLPDDYFARPLAAQIDSMIAHGLPEFVRWIEGWLDAAMHPLFAPRVLFTRYEDLHAAPAAFFAQLLGFYETGWRAPDFRPPPPQAGSRHYRKGTPDEWRSVFTPAQQEAACALIPARVRERFGWPAR